MVSQAILIIHIGADIKILLGGIEILSQLKVRPVARPLIGKAVGQIGLAGFNNGYPVQAVLLADSGKQQEHSVIQVFGLAEKVQRKGYQVVIQM